MWLFSCQKFWRWGWDPPPLLSSSRVPSHLFWRSLSRIQFSVSIRKKNNINIFCLLPFTQLSSINIKWIVTVAKCPPPRPSLEFIILIITAAVLWLFIEEFYLCCFYFLSFAGFSGKNHSHRIEWHSHNVPECNGSNISKPFLHNCKFIDSL